jgi:hypothetical protein
MLKLFSRTLPFVGTTLLVVALAPAASNATTKPSAKTIESTMLSALQSKSSIELKFVTKESGQTMSGIQWASHDSALQSTNYLGQTEHIMMIGSRLWVNDNASGLQSMFNATAAEANQWQNTWIAVPKSNSNYKFITSGLKGKSLFASFLPTGKVKVVGPKTVQGNSVYELIGKSQKSNGLGGFPMVVVVSASSPFIPLGTVISTTLGTRKFSSTLKVTGFNTKAPVAISVPTSAVAYVLTGMPK